MKQSKIYKLCLTGLLAAVVAVFTSFVKIPTGINNGYLHFGDSAVYLSGCLLGPLGMISSAIGGALADIMAGVPVWAVPTAIIKALNCLPFVAARQLYIKRNQSFKIVNRATVLMTAVSALITVVGYLVAESIIYTFPTALTSVPFSLVQGVGSAVIFVVAGKALDAVKIHRQIGG